MGAFFDLDGTLVDGFTATAHAGHRIRQRQAAAGEILGILEASVRYRIGRMPFERLLVRAAGYLRGESLLELDELGSTCSRAGSPSASIPTCAPWCGATRTAATPWC